MEKLGHQVLLVTQAFKDLLCLKAHVDLLVIMVFRVVLASLGGLEELVRLGHLVDQDSRAIVVLQVNRDSVDLQGL